MDTRRRVRGRADRREASRRRPGAERAPLTPAESALVQEVAAHIGARHAEGVAWEAMLIGLDEAWPHLPYRLALTALFWAQLTFERRQQKRALQ